MASYKEEHEKFVSGHNGTSVLEVSYMTLTPCACLLFRDLLLLVFGLQHLHLWTRVALDFTLVVVPAVLMNTVLSHISGLCSVVLFSITAVFCLITLYTADHSNLRKNVGKILNMELEQQRPFLNYTRALMNISTAIVILGVDFAAFPRRFAKTETFGTGYMDIGVGCFVISNALVSPEARGKSTHCRTFGEFLQRLLKSAKSSLPLLFFGFGRLLTVKSIDYHEHVSEYGVHWNFFFTLAVVKVVCTAALCLFPVAVSTALAVVAMSVYQYALSSTGLTQYILHGSDGLGGRQTLMDANREGIFSCVGYVALYLTGVQIGSILFSSRKQTFLEWTKKMGVLFVISFLGYFLQWLASSYIQQTSRRIANITFVFWITGLSVQVLWSCLAVDLLSTAVSAIVFAARKKTDVPYSEDQIALHPVLKSSTPCLLHAVNANGLFYFLLSNVMTGLTNMAVPTIHVSSAVAVTILLGYTFLLSVIIVFMNSKRISTKFW